MMSLRHVIRTSQSYQEGLMHYWVLSVGLLCHFNATVLSAIYLFDPMALYAGELTPTEQVSW
jgi:hypothetical protein